MESNSIQDRTLATVNKETDSKIRVVGSIESVDESIGTFVITDSGINVTCLPPVSSESKPRKGQLVTVVGRVVPAGNDDIEIRTDYIEDITDEDYKTYNSYLKQRGDLLSNGS